MGYESNLYKSCIAAINGMSYEERDEFVKSHNYKRDNSSIPAITRLEDDNRERILNRYSVNFTIDNLYEFCVVRNLITLLNQYGKLLKKDGSPFKRGFTLGHYKPLTKGGAHHISNWIIQTYKDNQAQGEAIPDVAERWTYTEQVNYIMSRIDYFLGVDETYLEELQCYISAFQKVYTKNVEEENE